MQIKPDKMKVLVIPKRATKERLLDILKDIKDGAPLKYASLSNGITEKQLYNIINQGKCDIEHGNEDSLCSWLVQSLIKIQAEDIKSCKKDIRNRKAGHRGAQWILEHCYWREFCGDAKLMELAKEMEFEAEKKFDEKRKQERDE